MKYQSVAFVITPEELKEALSPFTLFIDNAHVPTDYKSTPQSVFTDNYTQLYDKLCSGIKIDHRKDYELLDYFAVTTEPNSVRYGDKHLYKGAEYMKYKGTDRGYAPYFAPFTFAVYTENNKLKVSTRGSWALDQTDIMGFQLIFPKLSAKEALEYYNITSEKDWDSYNDYLLFKEHIFKSTSPFSFSLNGQKKTTDIRISDEVSSVIPEFYCIKKNDLIVLR